MLCSIERLAPGIFAEEKGSQKPVCANVDLFSGLIYHMLGISEDIYTPLFAIARVPGWCATGWRRYSSPTGSSARPTSTWVSARSINH